MKVYVLASVLSAVVGAGAAPVKTFSVNHYGGVGDGTRLETKAIQAAIDAAAKAHGTVVFKPGTYLSGSVFVKSGVTFRLDKGVVLMGSQNIEDYPMMPTRVAGIEMTWPAALVNVYEQSGAAIVGEGTIDGNGKVFWDRYWTLRKTYEPRGLRWASDYDARRPRLMQIFKSDKVRVGEGLHLRRSGFWTVHICYSHDVTVDGVEIRNNEGGHGPSTDGIDIDSSRKVLVAHADIAVNDDALCLKAGRDADGLRVDRPTEDVVLRDSTIREGAAGVTFGSETSGGFRRIEAYRLKVMAPVPVGILFKSAHTRGGFAEGVNLHDITMTDVGVVLRVTMNWNPAYSYAEIPKGMTDVPDYWKTLTTHVPEGQGIAHVRDVTISGIRATGVKTAFEVDAYPQAPVEGVVLRDWRVEGKTAGHIADVKDWTFEDVELKTADGSVLAASDDVNVKGIALKQVAAKMDTDAVKKSFAEQDKR